MPKKGRNLFFLSKTVVLSAALCQASTKMYKLNKKFDEGTIIVIEVPMADRHQKPIFVGGDVFKGTFKRGHEGDFHCTPNEVKAMLADSLDAGEIVPFAPLDAISEPSLAAYRQLFANRHPEHPWGPLSKEEFLIRLGAASKDEKWNVSLSKEGLLMFGSEFEIVKYISFYFLDYSYFSSNDPLARYEDRVCSSSGDWSGNLFDFLLMSTNKIGLHLPNKLTWMPKSEVRDDDSPLKRAIREAIVNAITNADFTYPGGLVLRQHPDEIVFENPGLLLVKEEQALKGGISDPRNKNIMKMLALLGMGERPGSGINLINSVSLLYAHEQIKIVQSTDPDRTTIAIKTLFSEEPAAPLDKNSEELLRKISSLPFRKEESEAIVSFALKTGTDPFTYEDLASFLKSNAITARKIIRYLSKEGIVTLAPFRSRGLYVFAL